MPVKKYFLEYLAFLDAAMADEKKVNCSKIFQDALKAFLGVEEPNILPIAQ